MSPKPLEGRVALVTGANHGIGAASAVELARLGADVAVAYLAADSARRGPGQSDAYHAAREQDATRTTRLVTGQARRCTAIEADLAEAGAPAELVARAESALGPVSILVHNASAWTQDTFSPSTSDHLGRTTSPVDWAAASKQLHVDALAGALLIAEVAAALRRHDLGWGRVVTLTSGGPMGFPGEVSYGAAKAALENYTMSASIELADDGITANVVHPPVTDTGWVTDEVRAFVATSNDHVHVAAPGEVAEVIGWLCTDAARLVTGNVLRLR